MPSRLPDAVKTGGSRAFVTKLLEETGVLGMPGFLFGSQFDRFVRFALVVSQEDIREILVRLERFCERNRTEDLNRLCTNL